MPDARAAQAQQQAVASQLEEHVRIMEMQREEVIARRRRNLLLMGASISLVCHLCLLIYLGFIHRGGVGGGGGTSEVSYEFAIDDSGGGLSELENTNLDEAVPQVGGVEESSSDAMSDLNPEIPSADKIGGASLVPGLAASGGGNLGSGEGTGGGPGGDDAGLGGGGGGGGTSFFGIGSKGKRFAYIVDISASMQMNGKIQTAMRELSKSLEGLPDFAQFYIVLFSTQYQEPPGQSGWTRARKPAVRQVVRWLSGIDPGGGTQPRPAFLQVFGLEERPDVVFFLTDGEIQNFTAEECAMLNSNGKRSVINTIAFGDPTSQDLLKQIASDSGGVYRFVQSGEKK
jgi:hypothetical protein